MSPYSRFGIGDLESCMEPRSLSMSGVNIGLTGKGNINFNNPASYISLDSMSVIIDFGVGIKTHELKQTINDNNYKNQGTSLSLTNLNLYFPVTRWLKMSFGLLPVSDVGYSVSEFLNTDPGHIGTYQQNFSGEGGLSKGYIGAAFGTKSISVGVNLNYIFGKISQKTTIIFEDDSLMPYPNHSVYEFFTKSKGFSADLGIQYTYQINKKSALGVGAKYTFASTLNASKDIDAIGTYKDTDSAYIGTSIKGEIKLPQEIGFGVSYNVIDKWLVGIDFNMSDWSTFESFGAKDLALNENLTWNLACAFEKKINRGADNFFKRLPYRAGIYYGKSYVDEEKKGLNAMGITAGFGIPIKRSGSMINFGFEIGRRGELSKSQIEDTYGRISVGISSLERWFYRPKFN